MKLNKSAVAAVIVVAAVAISAMWLLRGYLAGTAGSAADGRREAVIRGPGEFPIADRRVELEVFTSSSATKDTLDHNSFTKYVEEKLGIELTFVTTSPRMAEDTERLLLAGGDYPPIILGGNLTPEEQERYGRLGILRPLNGLIDRYGDRLKDIFRRNPELKKQITARDGNIYALPSVNECFHCWYAQKLWINTAWLNKLNLDMPTTTEELYRVLRAFKRDDPNGNGLHDEIPLSGAVNEWHAGITGFLMSAFIYNTDTNYLYIENGLVGMAAAQLQWREGLAYMHRLYREGLIDPDSFTQSLDGLIDTANRADNVLGSTTLGHIRLAFGSMNNTRHQEYDTVPPLIGPNGYQAAGYFNSFDPAPFAVTDKATEQEAAAAIRLADFLLTEEATVRNEWGPENKWWRKGKPGEVDEHGRQAKYWLNPAFFTSQTKNDIWDQMGLLYRDRDLRESWAVMNDLYSFGGYEHRLYLETIKNYAGKEPPEVYPGYIFMDPADAEESARLRGPIEDYILSNMVQFILGVKDTETDWDDYVNGLFDLKLDAYLQIHQRAYNAYKHK